MLGMNEIPKRRHISNFNREIEQDASGVDHMIDCIAGGGLEMIKRMQRAGAGINESVHCRGGRTALQVAAQMGNMTIVEYLIQEGVDVNAPPAELKGVTALQAAAIHHHFDIACKLLQEGADPNAAGAEEEGKTALEGAAERGSIDIMQLLLDNGADITNAAFGNSQFENAVGLAEKQGYYAAARLVKRRRKILKS